MGQAHVGLFGERYRIIAVEAERLTVKGTITGTVLTIINIDPSIPLASEKYPVGQLLALSDPFNSGTELTILIKRRSTLS
jgi:hypothetical protein